MKDQGNAEADFVVTPQGGTFFVGANAIVFPARAICDPSVSSYGPGTWDDPCVAAKSSIRIHATVRTAKLGTWIDFTPALRFVPSSDASQWVWLYMANPAVIGGGDLSRFAINYAASIGAAGVDESVLDPSLRTYIDALGATTLRRIKHFSGYTSSSGRACDPEVEEDCYPDNSGGQ